MAVELAASVRAAPGGARITVRAQPRASRSAVVGPVDDGRGGTALKVAIAAPPVDGAANDALTRLLATALGVARRDVTVVSGEGGRGKVVEVRGLDPASVLTRLQAALEAG